MVPFKLIELLTILCIIDTTIAYKCWVCSSDLKDSPFCGQILDEANLNRYQKEVNLVECMHPQNDKGITKCMIARSIYKGQTVYTRSCVYEDLNATTDRCMNSSLGYGHRMEACNTCMEDRCNYKLLADSSDGSTIHIETLYHIVFSLLTIVILII